MSKTSEKKASLKLYHMMYEQQIKHLTTVKDVDTLIDRIEKRLHPQEYALIVHDKDPGQEAHIHCMLSFKNARSLNNVAKLLGEKAQCLQKWDNRLNNGFAYLIHATEDAQDKYQYDPSEVRANFDYAARIEQIKAEVEKAKAKQASNKRVTDWLNMLYAGAISKKEVENQLTGSQYAQYHRKIEDIWAKRLENMAEAWRAEKSGQNATVKTIWIYGRAGTGKTSLAKEYAGRDGAEYYISGSSRDIFQNYAGEHTIILDELRPGNIPYSDLLKILDPHGLDKQVMAPSRYSDKALACDLFIVTTPYGPWEFYKSMGYSWKDTDKFEQLQRRITLTVRMESDCIYEEVYDAASYGYIEVMGTRRKNPYSQQGRVNAAAGTEDLYKALVAGAQTGEEKEEGSGEGLPVQ